MFNRWRRLNPKTLVLRHRDIVVQLVKAVIVLRMLFVYPVVVFWIAHPPRLFEIAVLVLLAVESLLGLLAWNRIGSFVQRHPLFLSVDILLSLAVLASAGSGSPFFLYLAATALLIGLLYEAASRALLTTVLLASFLAISAFSDLQRHEKSDSFGAYLTVLGGTAFLAGLVYLGVSLRRMQINVDTALQATGERARAAALGEERSRIARELHDSTVKSLIGIELLATAIEKSPDTAAHTAMLIRKSAKNAVDESRGLLGSLRAERAQNLHTAVKEIAENLGALYPVAIDSEIEEVQVSPEVGYAATKIVEEAMSNAARHSGTDRISVQGQITDGRLVVSVTDFGRGFRPSKLQETRKEPGHIGMSVMKERAAEVGGSVMLSSTAGAGTMVILDIPVVNSEEPDE